MSGGLEAFATRLEALDIGQIAALRRQLDATLAEKQAKRKAETLAEIDRLAEAAELLPKEVLAHFRGKKTPRKPRSAPKLPPKYADNSGNSWSGRGKRPVWLRTHLAAGRSLDDFRVGAPQVSDATA